MVLTPDAFDRKHGLDPNDPAYFWQRLQAMETRQRRAVPVDIGEARQLLVERVLRYWSIRRAKLGYQMTFNRRLPEGAGQSRFVVTPEGITERCPDPMSYRILVYTETRRPVVFHTIADLYRAAVWDVGFPRVGTAPDYRDEFAQLAASVVKQATVERKIPPDIEVRKRLKEQPQRGLFDVVES